ncbi:FG-GAP-like repeat-containing protein [Kitasatospora sp. NPDC056138]|uniref:FG-GAP-like repeat-containing protein n=1 Tax=Kitasatospora sp. NPDC056138 TaxID=3345724 RepID=UPI0035E1C537
MTTTRPRGRWAAALVATAFCAGIATTATTASALVGDSASADAYAFTAKLDIGGKRSCSGALVDPRWVVTAASCFVDQPAQGAKPAAGAPKDRTTVTVGRGNPATSAGHVVDAAELVPRDDRDLVMVRLAQPVFDVTPPALGTSAPAKGDTLRVTGFGRTKDEWVPDRLHAADFGVDSVGAATIGVVGKSPSGASICKGDTGGPAFRESNGRTELVGVNSLSWQGGCLGSSETRTGAVEVRTDDVAGWIDTVRNRRSAAVDEVGGAGRLRFADFDGDGKPDYVTIEDDGSVNVWLNHGGDPAGGWQSLGRVATGVTTDRSRVRLADFDGDGRADYIVINPDGSVNVWLNRGGDPAGPNGWQPIGRVATGTTTRQDQVRFADFDGDGRTDYLTISDDGSVNVWLNRGGDPAGGSGWQSIGQVATGLTTDQNSVFLTDFTGDGRADYLWNPGDGSTHAAANHGGDPAGAGGWADLGRIATGA